MEISIKYARQPLGVLAAYGLADIVAARGGALAFNVDATLHGVALPDLLAAVKSDAASERHGWMDLGLGAVADEPRTSASASDYVRRISGPAWKLQHKRGVRAHDRAPCDVEASTLWLGSGKMRLDVTARTLRDRIIAATADEIAASIAGRGDRVSARGMNLRLAYVDGYSGAHDAVSDLGSSPRSVDPIEQWLALRGWAVVGYAAMDTIWLPLPSVPSSADWIRDRKPGPWLVTRIDRSRYGLGSVTTELVAARPTPQSARASWPWRPHPTELWSWL